MEEMLTDAVLKEPPQQQASGRKGLPEASSSSRTSRPMRRHAELPPGEHSHDIPLKPLMHIHQLQSCADSCPCYWHLSYVDKDAPALSS